jgi:hypothetical protein
MTYKNNVALQVLFALLAIVFTAFTLSLYAVYLQRFISIQYSFYFELGMVVGQLSFQTLFILKWPLRVKLRYYLHLLAVSFTGSVLLWIMIGLHVLWPVTAVLSLLYFLAVVVFMFFEHKRRLAQIGLPFYLSLIWLLYRSLILLYIL